MSKHRAIRRADHCLSGRRHIPALRHWHRVNTGCGPAAAWDRFAPRIGGLRWRCTEEKYCRRCGKRLGMATPTECTALSELVAAGE
jgi:hypothetical protein